MHMLFNRRSAMDADSTFGIRISNGQRHARIYLSFKQWSEDNNLYRPEWENRVSSWVLIIYYAQNTTTESARGGGVESLNRRRGRCEPQCSGTETSALDPARFSTNEQLWMAELTGGWHSANDQFRIINVKCNSTLNVRNIIPFYPKVLTITDPMFMGCGRMSNKWSLLSLK